MERRDGPMCLVAAEGIRGSGLARGEELTGENENMSSEKTTRRPLRAAVAVLAPLAALAFAVPALAIAAPDPAPADAPQARITQAPAPSDDAPKAPITPAPPLSDDGPEVQITRAPPASAD